jgi:2-polyprenyl-3-methyl-5-hydroxy-6-metoxy-1,4-benzoquinol methylase
MLRSERQPCRNLPGHQTVNPSKQLTRQQPSIVNHLIVKIGSPIPIKRVHRLRDLPQILSHRNVLVVNVHMRLSTMVVRHHPLLGDHPRHRHRVVRKPHGKSRARTPKQPHMQARLFSDLPHRSLGLRLIHLHMPTRKHEPAQAGMLDQPQLPLPSESSENKRARSRFFLHPDPPFCDMACGTRDCHSTLAAPSRPLRPLQEMNRAFQQHTRKQSIMTMHLTDRDLHAYRRHAFAPQSRNAVREHLDNCEYCWLRWNDHRWRAARGSRLYRDLRDYLGDAFQDGFDSSRALAAEWDAAEPQNADEARAFFRRSTSYLYNLVIWEASGHRPDYATHALPLLRTLPDATILDYGCGIGSDSQRFRDEGFTVISCDFDSPSTQFMRWRHKLPSTPPDFVEPGNVHIAPKPDVLWITDTLDHLPDPTQELDDILSHVTLVISEDQSTERSHGTQRFHHRRSLGHINELFQRYGLAPKSAGPHLSCWLRHPH